MKNDELCVLREKHADDLEQIQAARPDGPRALWKTLDRSKYSNALQGACIARMAGCTLGALVEAWPIEKMQALAEKNGDSFPPVDYWSDISDKKVVRYGISEKKAYLRDHMQGVPADDDIAYTLLGLMIAEDYGLFFSTKEVAKAWLHYLPYACTAEDVALKNLKKGLDADRAATYNNPYLDWIGACIRSDPWAYMSPGLPENAAKMAYYDAMISHRKTGVYGAMFFAAAQAAAFAAKDAEEALYIGLTEIPQSCTLANEIRWALARGKKIKDYLHAREIVDMRYRGMSGVHTVNNAVLTVFGLMLGGNDVTRVLSQTVAMGLDNDCTAATAGSIVGALCGFDGVPSHWYKKFDNKIYTYLNGHTLWEIDDVLHRFEQQAVLHFQNIGDENR